MTIRRLLFFLTLLLGMTSSGWAEERYVAVLLDPRAVTFTKDTEATLGPNEDSKTDVIARRNLSKEEAEILLGLGKEELTDNPNVPFCGHWPAYSLLKIENGKVTGRLTLCGLCSTWSRGQGLRVLGGKKMLEQLSEWLPLPPAFEHIEELGDLIKMDQKTAFHALPSKAKPAEK